MKGVSITNLKRISNPKGDIQHALKSTEDGFTKFGEAYFTRVGKGDIKGWKKHERMELNLVVPVGAVTFFIHDETTKVTKKIPIGEKNYVRLTVDAGLWVAFRGDDDGVNLVLNIASIEHDPDESITTDLVNIPLES
ncbi:dTDP-4-dehydrorhamnose 3,5-epimerase [Vibrio fortis]|uniref:dTDP-4-dehydrorhamnose 3,5-epimerase n=1 Tax=Vibrio fortis TaxID=212667 RepID=A0A066UWU0_9VIBR|nr:dTDP-4-dehydrorhamnose 3,5-epimerase [Vibrio fortis]KDN28654.1 dTDP-4-dehydrorhamnose 3,5-epimerase [Vibrio fortis]